MSADPPTWSRALIPDDQDDEFLDDSYTEGELQRMDGNVLQSIAARHPSEEVNGRSKASDIREALVGEKRVEVDDA